MKKLSIIMMSCAFAVYGFAQETGKGEVQLKPAKEVQVEPVKIQNKTLTKTVTPSKKDLNSTRVGTQVTHGQKQENAESMDAMLKEKKAIEPKKMPASTNEK